VFRSARDCAFLNDDYVQYPYISKPLHSANILNLFFDEELFWRCRIFHFVGEI